MQWHTLKPKTKNKRKLRVGRGGKRGKTSGRGGKGQTARAGNKRRPELRDIIKKIPKARGYRFATIQAEVFPVSLKALEQHYTAGETVSFATLLEKGLVKRSGGKRTRAKILGTGTLTKKLMVVDLPLSASAKKAIEAVGGSVVPKA